jgi:hypothetical protein
MAAEGVFSWHELISRLPEKRPLIAGIVNATPDSFSDGKGSVETAERVAFALQLLNEGADLLDIGAESTRPGAVEVAPEEEWARLQPVLEKILEKNPQAQDAATVKAWLERAEKRYYEAAKSKFGQGDAVVGSSAEDTARIEELENQLEAMRARYDNMRKQLNSSTKSGKKNKR